MSELSARLDVAEHILLCTRCELHSFGKGPVPFSGPTPADIVVVGEAPGREEDRVGAPFVGPAGQLLRETLGEVADNACFVNTVSCFPGGPPLPQFVHACAPNLEAQLALANPKWVFLFGNTALGSFRKRYKITKMRGRPFCTSFPDPPVFLPTYHPAAALRNPEWKKQMVADIEQFLRLIETGNGWMEFVPEDCVECGSTTDVRFDSSGVAFCDLCWESCSQEGKAQVRVQHKANKAGKLFLE